MMKNLDSEVKTAGQGAATDGVALCREDWDFSGLPADEVLAALQWEMRREDPLAAERMPEIKDWLAGRLSRQVPKAADTPGAPAISAADMACARAAGLFGDFLPKDEFVFLHGWSRTQTRRAYEMWLAKHVRPLVAAWDAPWQRLPAGERRRLAAIVEQNRNADVVRVGCYAEAVEWLFELEADPELPLKVTHGRWSTVLLVIDWSNSPSRILKTLEELLRELRPAGVKVFSSRGRKHRDLLVMLERLGMMRLLHHYPLRKLTDALPEAARLYGARKWYDERRQAARDFRSFNGAMRDAKLWPVHWETAAARRQRADKVPGKSN